MADGKDSALMADPEAGRRTPDAAYAIVPSGVPEEPYGNQARASPVEFLKGGLHQMGANAHDWWVGGKPRNLAAERCLVREHRGVCDHFRSCQVKWADGTNMPQDGPEPSGAAVWYDAVALTELGSYTIWAGTAFQSKFILIQVIMLMLVQWGVVAIVHFTPDSVVDEKTLDTKTLQDARGTLNTLVAFLLGLFVSKSLDWWQRVRGEIGSVWGVIDNLGVLLGVHMPEKKLRDEVLRLCVCTMALTTHIIQHKPDFSDLVRRGVLTEKENALLQGSPCAAQVPWAWAWEIIQRAKEQDHLRGADPHLMQDLRAQVLKGHGSTGGIFGVISTQLPLFYVHAVCWVLKTYLLISAIVAGFVTSSALELHDHSIVFSECFFQCFLVPVTYQIVIDVHKRLHNPLTDKAVFRTSSYPTDQYEAGMRSESNDLSSRGGGGLPLPDTLKGLLRGHLHAHTSPGAAPLAPSQCVD